MPKAVSAPADAIRHYDEHQEVRHTLELIPEDSAVTTTTFFTTWLSQRETLYDVNYCSREHLLSSEYVVLDLTDKNAYKKYASATKTDGLKNLITLLETHGYTLYETLDQVLVIYRK